LVVNVRDSVFELIGILAEMRAFLQYLLELVEARSDLFFNLLQGFVRVRALCGEQQSGICYSFIEETSQLVFYIKLERRLIGSKDLPISVEDSTSKSVQPKTAALLEF
jgi:hypothetical protein